MFSTERSDFAVPIAGYLLVAFLLVFEGISFLFNGKFISDDADFNTVMVFGFILAIVGAFALYKAYIVDGLTFLIIGAFLFSFSAYWVLLGKHIMPSADIIVGVALLLTGAMAFRAKDLLVTAVDILSGLMFILAGCFFINMSVEILMLIAAILAFAAAAVALYTCYNDWALVQDIAADYEEELLNDCECDCCCGDDCKCDENCTCDNCKDKKE